jgi:hypothetical protein
MLRATMRAIGISVRLFAAAASFLLAAFLAVRSWWPLEHGYFSEYPDSPTGLYFTMAGTGAALAAVFATTGMLLLSHRFRAYGGFILLAAAAATAGALPYVLFKWTSVPETWPWALLVQDWIGWLRFERRPRSDGIAIQIALGLLVALALVAQVAIWRRHRTSAAASAAPI